MRCVSFPYCSVMEQTDTAQSSSKRHKVSDVEQTDTQSIDRLSTLPDGVLCRILSFLPTKMSVATSILAKRWMLLWAHVPDLRFDHIFKPEVIYMVMLLHKAKTINTFVLSDMHHYNKIHLNAWIKTAVERNVRNLVLHTAHKLPRCLFTCKTLVDLSIPVCTFNPSCGPISLPSLKRLHLYDIEYYEADEEAFPRFLSGCPVLEELIIKAMTIDPFLDRFVISSPTIKRLTIDFPCYGREFRKIYYRVVIDAPALEYLRIIECSSEHISLSPMNSLIEADVCLKNDSEEQRNDACCLFVSTLFKCLRNVKCLKLSGRYKERELRYLEFIDRIIDGPSVRFNNLTKLELKADWRFLTKLIENADNLQALTIHEISGYLKIWMEPEEKWRASLLNSLTTVTVHKFHCIEQEFDMVKYILGNARVLKRMEIYSEWNGIKLKNKFDAVQKISLFHRESRECEVAFF